MMWHGKFELCVFTNLLFFTLLSESQAPTWK